MCTVKPQSLAPFPIYYYIYTIVPNEHECIGQNAQWSVILDKYTEISSKCRLSALSFSALFLCFSYFSSFQTAHRNKNNVNLRTN